MHPSPASQGYDVLSEESDQEPPSPRVLLSRIHSASASNGAGGKPAAPKGRGGDGEGSGKGKIKGIRGPTSRNLLTKTSQVVLMLFLMVLIEWC